MAGAVALSQYSQLAALRILGRNASFSPTQGRRAVGRAFDYYVDVHQPRGSARTVRGGFLGVLREWDQGRADVEPVALRDAESDLFRYIGSYGQGTDAAEHMTHSAAHLFVSSELNADGIAIRPVSVGSDPGQISITRHGAIIYHTSENKDIVLGLPTSSVKDLFTANSIDMVVIPTYPLMNFANGIHRGESESFKYFRFFVQTGLKEGANILADSEVGRHLDVILNNSYLGPQHELTADIVAESYPLGKDTPGFPNLQEELNQWKGFPLDALRKINNFGKNQTYTHGNVMIRDLGGGRYRIFEAGEYVGEIDTTNVSPVSAYEERNEIETNGKFQEYRKRILIDGEPALVPIHSGSLFTRQETSGFILFRNGRATLVDPPIDTIEWLKANNIPLDVVDEIVVTHVHVDHMGGALRTARYIPHRVKLTTDRIVFDQMMEIYESMALGRVGRSFFEKIWDFNPVMMLSPGRLENGLWVKFNHAFHSVPTVAFTLYDRNPAEEGARPVISFSGDTQMNPGVLFNLINKRDPKTGNRVISSADRAMTIMRQPVEAFYAGGISVVDAGAAPLHNTEAGLAKIGSLYSTALQQVFFTPPERQGQIFAYHTSPEAAEAAGLQYLGSGVEAAIMFGDQMGWNPAMARTTQDVAMDVLRRSAVFRTLTLDALHELLPHVMLDRVGEGNVLMNEGDQAGDLFIVVDGEFSIRKQGAGEVGRRRSGVLGERALVMDQPRTATVRATQEGWVLRVDGEFAKKFLKKHGLAPMMIKIAQNQDRVQNVISLTPLFKDPTGSSVDAILHDADYESYSGGTNIIVEGDTGSDVFLVLRGDIEVWTREGRISGEPLRYGPGAIVGEMALITNQPRAATVTAASDVDVLRIPADAMRRLNHERPGTALPLIALMLERQMQNGLLAALTLPEPGDEG